MTEPFLRETHEADALGRLPERFQNAPGWAEWLRVVTPESQELENALWALIELRLLTNAFGAGLDQWGVIVDESRDGLTDAEYKRRRSASLKVTTEAVEQMGAAMAAASTERVKGISQAEWDAAVLEDQATEEGE